MAQQINFLWNNSFVNATPLPQLCDKTGALYVVEPDLAAGWQAGHQADKNVGK